MPAFAIAAAVLFAGLRVVDPGNAPVAGAAVRIWMPPGDQHDLASRVVPLCEGTTSKDGAAPCSVPRLAGALLVVDAPGFEPLIQTLDGKPLDRVVLAAGSSLKGHVVKPKELSPEAV